jgi:hypothetical protein
MCYDAQCKKHRIYGVPSTAASTIICISIMWDMKIPHGIDSIYMGCHLLLVASTVKWLIFSACLTSPSLNIEVPLSSSS